MDSRGNRKKLEGLAGSVPGRRPRLYFLDNLKVLLVVLVVFHHAGLPYGPGSDWWVNPEPLQPVSKLLLGIFFSINTAFFMGLFFMISAYFVPGSLDRKGPARFMSDRLSRLGTPVLIFVLGVFPVMKFLILRHGPPFSYSYASSVPFWSPVHLWFLVMLLVFSACYVAIGMAAGRGKWRKSGFPGNVQILMFAAVMALATFIVRIWFPASEWVLFNLFEPAHIVQYMMLFAAGIVAYRCGWFEDIPAATAKFWWLVAALMVPAIPVIDIAFGGQVGGGLSLASLAESTREALLCMGMCIGLLSLFKSRLNRQGRMIKALADNAFTVYLIHLPVVIFLQYLLAGVAIHPLLKFLIVGAVAVPACFAVGQLVIRKVPLLKDVL